MNQRKGFKEWGRKKIVSLKRNPQRIALVAYVLTFLYYALNLTCISDTTAKIQGSGMGLCGFATMLFSILSLVSFLNAFPHRKKVNKPMLILLFVMTGIIFYADYHYRSIIYNAVNRADNPIAVTANTMYIKTAADVLSNHMIFLGISLGLVVLLPLYSKLLKKINTAVEIDSYDDMEAIDISGEN